MGWAEYNKKKSSASSLFAKLRGLLTLRELEELALCRNELLEMIYKELDKQREQKRSLNV